MLFERWMDKMWQKPPRIVFTDGMDARVLKIARRLADTGLARPMIIGNQFEIRAYAEEQKIRMNGVALRKALHHPAFDVYCRAYKKQYAPQQKISEIRALLQQPALFAGQMLLHGDADLCFLSRAQFNEFLPPFSRWFSDQSGILSSFALIWNEKLNRLLTFSDPLFYPRPTAEQLAEIAVTTARNFEKLSGERARVALLSFSTMGSASHPMAQVVQQAVELIRQKEPHLKVEGEMQFDAAFVPEIGRKKAPGNRLDGAANVYVFPSLNAANIGLKIVQALTPYRTVGPIVQGLSHALQVFDEQRCEEGLFHQVIVASNLLNP
ncbi:phosphate acyltransferase [Caldithrix abyssi]